MSQFRRAPLPLIFFAVTMALVVMAGTRFYSALRQYWELKAQSPLTDSGDLQALAEQRQAADETNRLGAQRLMKLKAECAQLQKSQMPLTPAATRELQLQVLELARHCDFEIQEISPVNASATPPPNGNGGNGNGRPQVRLQCQAGFPGIARFIAGLSGLKWTVTPESLSIGQPGASTTTAAGEDSATKNDHWQIADTLNVTMILTF